MQHIVFGVAIIRPAFVVHIGEGARCHMLYCVASWSVKVEILTDKMTARGHETACNAGMHRNLCLLQPWNNKMCTQWSLVTIAKCLLSLITITIHLTQCCLECHYTCMQVPLGGQNPQSRDHDSVLARVSPFHHKSTQHLCSKHTASATLKYRMAFAPLTSVTLTQGLHNSEQLHSSVFRRLWVVSCQLLVPQYHKSV